MLVQNLRNLGQTFSWRKDIGHVPRVGRHSHWHTMERAGSAAEGPDHQQRTRRNVRVTSASRRARRGPRCGRTARQSPAASRWGRHPWGIRVRSSRTRQSEPVRRTAAPLLMQAFPPLQRDARIAHYRASGDFAPQVRGRRTVETHGKGGQTAQRQAVDPGEPVAR